MKIHTRLLGLIITIFVLSSCGSSQKEQTTEAGEAKEVAEIEESATEFNVDTSNSVITWIGSKPTGQHNGTINLKGGTVAVTDGEVTGGKVTLDITSLEDKDLEKGSEMYTKLVNHLMSDDFFAAEQYPTANFEIVEVKPYDSAFLSEDKEQFESDYTPATISEYMVENPTHYVTGNLTMRGVTKSISFPAKINVNDNGVKAEAKFNIDRTDWKLMYGDEASVVDKAKDKFIYNTVNVGFSFSATENADS